MHNLKSLTPLGAANPRQDRIGRMALAENTEAALASISARRGQEDALRVALVRDLSLDLPGVGQVAQSGPFAALWSGAEQWMISAPYDSHEDLAAEVKAVVGATASVVEQTDAWCRFDLSGPDLCDMSERLCNAPIRTMAEGTVLRTSMEHIGVFLWRRAPETVAVLGPRSSAASLHHALVAAARSIA